ncbi:MAG TPA: hypothetical protein VG710_02410 [Opitutus sp.]|nr:hypothetical protein [Opitutus sp.]
MKTHARPPEPNRVAGNPKGEEFSTKKGLDPGRGSSPHYRGPRDSTGINADARKPIHPAMPGIPSA